MNWLTAVRALAGAHVAAVRERWAARPGMRSTHEVIDEIVTDAAGTHRAEALDAAAAAAHDAIAADGRWRALIASLAIARREVELLALVAACELDPRLTRVLGYLDDSAAPAAPTPAAAAVLWAWPLGAQPGPASALARWQLATPDGPWQSTTPWTVDADIAAYLAGASDWSAMRAAASVLDVDGLDCLHPSLIDELHAAASRIDTAGCEVELVGPTGSGRRTLLAQLAGGFDRPAAVIAAGAGVRGLRTAHLLGAVPIWVADDGELVGVDATPGALTLVARSAASAVRPDGVVRLTRAMPGTSMAQRRSLWAARTSADIPRVAVDWDVSPGDISTGAAAAGAGTSVATAVLRGRLRAGSLDAMTSLTLPYDWDDLVVPEHVSAQLHQFRQQVLLRTEVLDGWEFRRLCPTAAGVTALFAGPSGTGKTMAAQVIARSLDLDLFRIDLAAVVSKYIGETEKQLAAVFDQAERSNVLVFFDEADALFGRRTRVQDAHDRYANIEIDYLLQRLDTFRGVAVLATNRKSDLDAAFLRRLRTIVDFVAPGEAERLRLWRLALPSHTSTGEQVTGVLDHEWLAAQLELTGAEIKSIALVAAFDARGAGALITNQTVLDASRRELGKRGAVLRAEHPVAVAR